MPIDIVEVDEFTEAITVPEAGDDRTAASIVPAFQGVTNRTRNLQNRVNGLPGEDWTFTGSVAFNWETNINGTIKVANDLQLDGAENEVMYEPERVMGCALETPHNAVWVPNADYRRSTCNTNHGVVSRKIPVPPGCTLKKVIATIATGGSSVPASLFLRRLNAGTVAGPTSDPSVVDIGQGSHSTGAGTEGVQVLCSVVANKTSYIEALIVASDNAATSQNHLLSVYYEFTDVGPRNGA
jgi:hypothetical protein